jgi:hypothetical protein
MHQRPFQAIAMALVMVAVGACGSTTPPSPIPSASAAASLTFVESMAAFCSSFRSIVVGVGNPDAGTNSDLRNKLDEAVASGDTTAADMVATVITTELEKGRAEAEVAAGYPPIAPAMVAMSKLFVAYEAEIDARRADADHTRSPTPGVAFKAAGGDEAYFAMLDGISKLALPPGSPTPAPCPALSGTP